MLILNHKLFNPNILGMHSEYLTSYISPFGNSLKVSLFYNLKNYVNQYINLAAPTICVTLVWA